MEWKPIETAELRTLWSHNSPVLVATSEGVVTQARVFELEGGAYMWSCADRENVADPRHPSEYLRFEATHWMPLPTPPEDCDGKE